jgi:cytochrome c553
MVLCAILLVCGACDAVETPRDPQVVQPRLAAFEGAERTDASAKLAHGERMATVLGCRGCHGKDLKGNLWDNDPNGYGVMWASNLTQAIPSMTDAQLKDLLTIGTHPRRADLWVMPSELFQHLDSGDLEALMIYLRSLAPAGEKSPDPVLGPRAIAELKSGEVKPAAQLVKELRSVGPADLGPEHSLGRYITMVACAECHGPKLKGREGDTPDLVVASGYSREEFERLITEGVPTGNRKLKPLMQDVAQSRYSQLTKKERDALYNYLKALAEHGGGQ